MYTEESLRDKLINKLEKEQKEYLEEMKKLGIDEIINNVYEINARNEIMDYISYKELEPNEIIALLNEDKVLDRMYDEWLGYDGNFYEALEYPIEMEIERITDEFHSKDKKEIEQEDKTIKKQNKSFER